MKRRNMHRLAGDVRALCRLFRGRDASNEITTRAPFVPAGHFYSPIVDVAAAAERELLWPAQPVAHPKGFGYDGGSLWLTKVVKHHASSQPKRINGTIDMPNQDREIDGAEGCDPKSSKRM